MRSGILLTVQKPRLGSCKLYLLDNGNKDYQAPLLLTAAPYLLQFPSKIEMILNCHRLLNPGIAKDKESI